ncbi:MAG: 4Fe-4S binding protein [Proteobacteria bacterium]|nr:4Fe-4S binding protein [Pseudomonadota bacterium]
MLKSLQIEPEKCTGCLQCEMACSYEATGLFNPAKSRIKVFTFHEEGRFVPYTCTQCEEDVLVGAQSLGLTQHVGVLRGLIQTRIKLGKWKQHLMKDPTRLMEAYLGCTQALGHNAGII